MAKRKLTTTLYHLALAPDGKEFYPDHAASMMARERNGGWTIEKQEDASESTGDTTVRKGADKQESPDESGGTSGEAQVPHGA